MSSGRCWSSDTYNPVPGVMEGVPSGNNYQGGFGTQLMAKVGLPFTSSLSSLSRRLVHKCLSVTEADSSISCDFILVNTIDRDINFHVTRKRLTCFNCVQQAVMAEG